MRFKTYYLKEEIEKFDIEHMSSLKTYNQRLVYCRLKLKKLGAGSSREVFDLDDNWVLKLAKNDKGLGQNRMESDYGLIDMFKFLPNIKDSDDEDRWIIVEKCEKITPKEFESLTNINFKLFSKFLYEFERVDRKYTQKKYSEDIIPHIEDEDDFIFRIRDLLGSTDLLPGDFEKISSFGKHKGKIKVIDWGFTKDVHKTYYQK